MIGRSLFVAVAVFAAGCGNESSCPSGTPSSGRYLRGDQTIEIAGKNVRLVTPDGETNYTLGRSSTIAVPIVPIKCEQPSSESFYRTARLDAEADGKLTFRVDGKNGARFRQVSATVRARPEGIPLDAVVSDDAPDRLRISITPDPRTVGLGIDVSWFLVLPEGGEWRETHAIVYDPAEQNPCRTPPVCRDWVRQSRDPTCLFGP